MTDDFDVEALLEAPYKPKHEGDRILSPLKGAGVAAPFAAARNGELARDHSYDQPPNERPQDDPVPEEREAGATFAHTSAFSHDVVLSVSATRWKIGTVADMSARAARVHHGPLAAAVDTTAEIITAAPGRPTGRVDITTEGTTMAAASTGTILLIHTTGATGAEVPHEGGTGEAGHRPNTATGTLMSSMIVGEGWSRGLCSRNAESVPYTVHWCSVRPPPPRSPSPNVDEEERDKRTVFVMQIAARCRTRELAEFFMEAGKVRDARIIADRNSRRSKG
ncbi:MAG: hypothetical protein BJ554DRAFT_3002 [Olpidium bornovanus]|uniref:RRM domain-containing protein n=1 Tax=Olpidium bornovanus TaxID=278681 RepID=A0A8H8DLL9_9FUNG|nr:MAG: hypothetical protein BJ554DRAFT_3002 [Olpidium bornovanus]